MSNGMIRDTDRQPAPELERLVAQYQGAVLRTCYLYLCDRSQAEDAVQETFLKVYRNLNGFRIVNRRESLEGLRFPEKK